jgi:prevent-host-death family protein
MRTVSITEIRQDATRLIDEAERTHTPLLVVQRSRATAYVIPAADYEAIEQELRELRHQVFWQEVDEAWAEHERGESTVYEDVEDLIADLGLEQPVVKRRPTARAAAQHPPAPKAPVAKASAAKGSSARTRRSPELAGVS